MIAGQFFQPVCPDRAIPIIFDVTHVIANLDQRWAVPGNPISDASPIGAGGKRDAMLQLPALYGWWLITCLKGCRNKRFVRAEESHCSGFGDGLGPTADAQLVKNLSVVPLDGVKAQ